VTPVAGATLAFAAGIVLSAYQAAPTGGLLLFGALAMALAAIVVPRSAEPPLQATVLGFLLAGVAAGGVARLRAAGDCAAAIPADAAVTATGTLEALPVDGGTVPLRVQRLAIGTRTVDCRTTLRVRPRGMPAAAPAGAGVDGASLVVHGRWRRFAEDGVFPRRPARLGVVAADSIVPAHGAAAVPRRLRTRLDAQERVRRLYPRDWPLAEALVLARREGLAAETRERFVAAGLAHLLAISGTHVALFAGALLLAARILRLPLAAAYAVAALGTVAYVILLGAPHAAARAALQLLIFLGTRLAQRPVEPQSAVAFAALVLLAHDPLAILDPGFQLSFAGVLGIVRLRRPLLDALPRAVPRWLRDALATGAAASVFTTPIAGLHFQQISLIGVVSGVVALPVLAATVPALALTLLLDPLAPGVAAFLAAGAALLLRLLDAIAAAAAAVPGGHGHVTPLAVLAALAAAATFLALRRGAGATDGARARATLRGATVAFGIAVLAPPLWVRAAGGGGIEIHALDVGQGDAFAVRTPAGRWILIDAGPASATYDAGARVVAPFLRARGARRVDALVLSHPHADHIGGVPAIAAAFDVRLVIDPGVPAPSRFYLDAVAAAQRAGASWLAARPGLVVTVDGVALEFLYPTESVLDGLTDPNDYSAVFRLRYGRFGALFLGDAPAAVENALVGEDAAALASQLIKIGHHGSRTSTGDSLLSSVAPALALISAGRRNRYGHPAPEVMARLAHHGVSTLRTDSAGTVRIRATAAGALSIRQRR
jgi:competence protein ComEC